VRTARWIRQARGCDAAATVARELARSLGIRRAVRVLESAAVPVPLTWGVVRPVILLPTGSAAWPEGRLSTVLLHELLHVRRFDLLSQSIAQAACSLFWFHPLAWLGLRELRREREQACDDAVLRLGVPAHDYAGHIMDLVRSMAGKARWGSAVAMADRSDLELRVRALLDRGRNRRPLNRRAAVGVLAAACAVLLPVAAVSLRAQASAGGIAGVVSDSSGARVPRCVVTARNLDGANLETTTANAAGEYRFSAIPAGRYEIQFQSPGFAPAKMEAVLVSGAVFRADGHLELGMVQETVTVQGKRPPSALPATAGTPQRIRVGGNVTPVRLVRKTNPEYPAEVQQLGVEGTVVVRAVISTEGAVLNPEVVSTVDPRLAKAALDAVRAWLYEPARLNGQPVETRTNIKVDFQLAQ
jgi:TonB family protein